MSTQLRVLIVEDSESDAGLVARRLEQAGNELEYERVETAEEMRVALAKQDWDLVIADYQMPEFSAPAALEILKGCGQDLPFIIVSGAIGEDNAVTMMKAGAHDYVMKDNLARLVPAVERELREAEGRRERRRVEDALIKSEGTLSTVLKGAPVGIGLVQNRVFHWVNDKLLNMTGYTREELIGQSARIFYTSEAEFKRVGKVKYDQIMKDGWGEVDTQFQRNDGSLMEIYLRSVAVNPGDLSAGVVFTAMDITARKQAEEAIRSAAHKWRITFDAIGDAVCLLDRESRVIQCNQAMADLVAKPFSEIVGRHCWEVVHMTTGPIDGCPVVRMKQSGKRETLTLPFGDRWLHGIADPILNEIGEVTGGVHIIADITEYQRATEKIKDLNSLLYAIKEINEALLRVKNEKELFQQTCDLLKGVPYVRFAWVGLVQPDSFEVKPVAWAGVEEGYLSVIKVNWDDSPFGSGPIGVAFRTGQPFIRRNIETDNQSNLWREEALKRGYKSSIALPLIHDNEVIGVLKVYSGKTDAFGSEETAFLNQVAGDIAVGVRSLRLEQELVASLIKSEVMLIQTIEAITFMAELRDPYTAGHQQGVTRLACTLAREMGLADARIEGIRVAGLLHDIGKIIVPAEILSKPGRLNEYEFRIIKNHSQAGYDILKKIDFPWPVAEMIIQHHERLNGSGYPSGLADGNILLESRILAVADVVEAMAAHRPYRPALGIDKALEEISKNKGLLYDPEVVDACLRLFNEKKFIFEAQS
jgi:PAS domain S-box-containing protein/putative nucleotidyltransferase with HDIG domain